MMNQPYQNHNGINQSYNNSNSPLGAAIPNALDGRIRQFDPFGYNGNRNQSNAVRNTSQSPSFRHQQGQHSSAYQSAYQPYNSIPMTRAENISNHTGSRDSFTSNYRQQNGLSSTYQITSNYRQQNGLSSAYQNNYTQAQAMTSFTPNKYQQTGNNSTNYHCNVDWNVNNEMNGYRDYVFDTPQNSAQYILSDELMGKIQSSNNKKALLELQIGFEQLVVEPADFETWANVIRDRLSGKDLSEDDLGLATAILIEMATVLNDSQYNFSRLCKLLSTSLNNYTNILLTQISDFVQSVEQYLSSQHLRNLVVFLAEVYDKVEVSGIKPSIVAAHIFDQLTNIIKLNPLSDADISSVTQVLKLTGRYLENDRGTPGMDALFEELNACAKQAGQSVTESAKAKIISLELLRSNDWGYSAQQNAATNNFALPELTEEESAFLDKNLEELGISPGGSPYNSILEDDNVEEDYERFLQATAIRTAEKALEKISFDDDDASQ